MKIHATPVLKLLSDTAVKEAELATEALAKAMKQAFEAQNKYDLLLGYRQDYLNNLNRSLENGINAEAHQNFTNFLGKLDQAVAGQMDIVRSAKYQVTMQRQLWQECQRKKLSYEVLATRNGQRLQKVELKKDQKAMDEFAMRASRKSRA